VYVITVHIINQRKPISIIMKASIKNPCLRVLFSNGVFRALFKQTPPYSSMLLFECSGVKGDIHLATPSHELRGRNYPEEQA